MKRVFEQNGLVFSYVTGDDLPDLRNMLAKSEVCRFFSFGPNTQEETDAFFQPIIEGIAESFTENKLPDDLVFVIREKNRFVGYCGLLPIAYAPGNNLIGFAIDAPFWRKGFGEAACRFLIDFASRIPKLYRISGDCMEGNHGSRRIMEKCDFQFEGTQKQYWFKNGRYYDNLLFGLILERGFHEK